MDTFQNSIHNDNFLDYIKKNIPKYKILKEIGRGGMGIVYLAVDTVLNRKVAIKFILNPNAVAIKRFQREARAVARLDHKNIIRLYEFNVEKRYIVMQYVEGINLNQYLKRNLLNIKDKTKLFAKIVSATIYAHNKSIIHRDIKPANILVDALGNPYLMDFGVAKIINQKDYVLTKTGAVLGSPHYMSPEQATGSKTKISYQTDIYSLGAIFYEMLTGQLSIPDQQIYAIIRKLLQGEITPPRKLCSEVPRSLDLICMRALERKLTDRYKQTEDMLQDINLFLDGKSIKKKRTRSFYIRLFSTLITLSIVAVFVFFLRNQETNIQIIPLVKVKKWLDLGYYEEAERELIKNCMHEKKFNTYMAIVNAKIGNLKKYKSYFSKLSLQEQQTSAIKIAQAEIAMQNQQFTTAKEILFRVFSTNTKKLQKILSGFYLGQIFYIEKQYEEALFYFEDCARMLDSAFVFKSQLFMYLGKCKIRLGALEEAGQHFEQVKKLDGNSAQLLFWWGKLYRKNKNLQKAQSLLLQSLELEKNSDCYTELGRVYRDQKMYQKAVTFFLEAQNLDLENFEAFEEYAKIAFFDVAYLEKYYYRLINSIASYKYSPPNLLLPQVKNNLSRLISVYNQVTFLRNQKYTQEIPDDFFNIRKASPHVLNLIKKKWKTIRYHPDFEKKISNVIQRTPQLFSLYEEIQKQKNVEEKYYIYYLLNKLYIRPSFKIGTMLLNDILFIFQDEKEDMFYRYLAGKALFSKGKFEIIVKSLSSDNIACKTIAITILKEMGLRSKKQSKLTSIDHSLVLAKSITSTNFPSDKVIINLLQSSMPMIALETANACFQHPRLSKMAIDIWLKYMDSEKNIVRENAYYYYGKHGRSLLEKNSTLVRQYREILEKSLQKKDIISTTLLENLEYLNFEDITDVLHRKTLTFPKVKFHIGAINIFIAQNKAEYLQKYQQNKNNIPLLRAYAIQKQVVSACENFTNYTKNANKKMLERIMVPNVSAVVSSKEVILKSYGYFFKSLIRGDVADDISKEQDPDMKAIILLCLTTGEGTDKKFINFLGKFVKEFAIHRDTTTKRLNEAKKYLRSSNGNIRLSAYLSYIYLATVNERKKIVNEVLKSKDTYAKRGAAKALFWNFKKVTDVKGMITELKYSRGAISESGRDHKNIYALQKILNRNQGTSQIAQKLRTVVSLDSNVPEYSFYLALTEYRMGNLQKAKLLLANSIKLDPDFIFSYIFLAEITKGEKRNSILQKIHDYVSKKYLCPECLIRLLGIKNPIMEKILKQNYVMIALSKQKRFATEDREIAWRNIQAYYRKHFFKSNIYQKLEIVR